MKCSVCDQTEGVVKCARPSCPTMICPRHGLRYEISDAQGMRFETFCSRDCYIRTLRRALPGAQELYIALIVIIVAALLYMIILRAATQGL